MTTQRSFNSTRDSRNLRRRRSTLLNALRRFRPSVERLEDRSLLSALMVTNTADSGAGSLRQAILDANATVTPDQIHFRIPGSGVKTIIPATPLPAVTQPVVIDGYTQDGDGDGNADASPNTLAVGNNAVLLIELDGRTGGAGGAGLHFQGTGSTARGLVINHSFLYGVYFESGSGNTIEGNFIGTDPTGTVSTLGVGNLVAGVKVGSPNNLVGGSTPAARNLISGNGHGFQGGHPGIIVNGTAASNIRIQGNYIGTNAAGTAALPNSGQAVIFLGAGNDSLVGGLTPIPGTGAGNLISGSNSNALRFEGGGQGHFVQGNIIGLNATGNAALGNIGDGVSIGHGLSQVTVGGTAAAARNVISASKVGIDIASGFAATTNIVVQGNYIGTDITGTLDHGNGYGIHLNATHNTLIGGTTPGAGNVVSGSGYTYSNGQGVSTGIGIEINFFSTGTTIQGNYIGVAADGVSPLGNAGDGISMPRAHNTLIGGTDPGAANVIAYSGNDSHVPGGAAAPGGKGITIIEGIGNAFLGNSIYSNTGLGIDLFDDDVTANDQGDSDSGYFGPVNYLQNFPVLSVVTTSGGSTTAVGSLNSAANTTYRIEFFANSVADPSGFGEGKTYIGFTTVTTDANGDANFNVTLPVSVPVAEYVTATATDPAGNTSEFSQVRSVAAGNSLPFFTSTPVTAATEDAAYSYAVTTDDPDAGQARTIVATTLPAWQSLVDNGDGTATLSGTPTNSEVGGHGVELVVTDAAGASTTQWFTITVANVNDAPFFTSAPVTAATEDVGYTSAVTTADPDFGDTRTIASLVLPAWLNLVHNSNGTASLIGTPTNDDLGSHSVELTVTDAAGAWAAQSFIITVANVNDAPYFTSTPVIAATEDAAYSFALTTADPDYGDTRTIISATLPTWLTLTDSGDGTATVEGLPTDADVGDHEVELVVMDAAGASAVQSFTITVSRVNDSPFFTSTPVIGAAENAAYTYAVTTADPDVGDTRNITATILPMWLTLAEGGDGTANLSGTPSGADVGTHAVELVVTDAAGAISVQSFLINVGPSGLNLPPQITSLSSSAPNCGCTIQGMTVTIQATFIDTNAGDTHTAMIDWGDGQTSPGTLNGAGTVSAEHVYAEGGIYAITLILADQHSALDQETTQAVISGVALRGGVLQIIGTSHDDHVTVNELGKGLLKVHADFLPDGKFRTFQAVDVEQIVILLCDGDDHATVAGNIAIETILDGGQGNDHLNGGRGPNIFLGGAGEDTLIGGAARDLMIGGLGADRLIGNGGDDLLIGGTTAYDQDSSALLLLLAEWNADWSYDTRVARLRSGSGPLLETGTTVFDDGARDKLTGSAQQDWFFFLLGEDEATDLKPNEESN